LFTVTVAVASPIFYRRLSTVCRGIAIARGRHRRGPLPLRFTYTSSSLDVYGRFGVLFLRLVQSYTKEAFTDTVAVASSVFCPIVHHLSRPTLSYTGSSSTRSLAGRRVHLHVCCVARSLSQHSSSLLTITSYTIAVLSLHPSYPATVHLLTRTTLPCGVAIDEVP